MNMHFDRNAFIYHRTLDILKKRPTCSCGRLDHKTDCTLKIAWEQAKAQAMQECNRLYGSN